MAKNKDKKPNYQAKLFSFRYLLHDIVKWFGSWQCLLWYRIKRTFDGPEAKKKIKGKAIISSNHVALADPFILQCSILYRRWHFVFMTDLIKNKFQDWAYRNIFLSFPINRDTPSYKTMKLLSEYVKGGNLLAIFPEGHIKTDNVVDDFKGGAVLIAYLSDAPIIPIYHKRRKSVWNMTRVVIGKPFDVKAMIGPVLNQDKIKEVSEELHQYELHLQELCEKEMSKK